MFHYNFKKSRNFWIPLSCGIFLVALLLFLVVSRSSNSQTSDSNAPTSLPGYLAYLLGYNTSTTSWDRVHIDTGGNLTVALTSSGGNAAVITAASVDGVSAAGNGLETRSFNYLLNGTGWDRVRTPVIFKPLNAISVASETTIWTPSAGKKFRFMGYTLAQGTVSGGLTLKDNTAGTTIFIIPPQTAGAEVHSPPMGNGILSAVANNVLTATGSATETITGTIWGTEE